MNKLSLIIILVMVLTTANVFGQELCQTKEQVKAGLEENIKLILADEGLLSPEIEAKVGDIADIAYDVDESFPEGQVDLRELNSIYYWQSSPEQIEDAVTKFKIQDRDFRKKLLDRTKDIEKKIELKKYVITNSQGYSDVIIRIIPLKEGDSLEGVEVYELIPKSVIADAAEIVSSNTKYSIKEADPLIVWNFEKIDSPQRITYRVNEIITEEPETIIIAEEGTKVDFLKILISLILVPILAFVLIAFNQFRRVKI